MEKTFSEQLATIKLAIKQGDVARLTKMAGVSEPTFRKTFTRQSALELTEAEKKVLKVCTADRTIKQRIADANRLEVETKRVTEIANI